MPGQEVSLGLLSAILLARLGPETAQEEEDR